MLRSRRGRRQVKMTVAAGSLIEPLEPRSLLSVAAIPLAPGTPGGHIAALSTLTPTFTWSPVTGVNGYQLRVLDRTDGTFALIENVGSTTTQYTAKAGTLLPGRFYSWTVRDVVGFTAAPSRADLYFGTPVPLPPVAATAGADGSARPVLSTLKPTLTWSAVPDVSGYVLHVTDQTTGTTVTETAAAAATSFTFAAGALEPGHRFAWNVHDEIGTTTARAVSNTEHFQLPTLPPPVTLGPGTAAAAPGPVLPSFTPTFSWSPVTSVAGFTGYELTFYDRTKGGTAISVTEAASATSYTLPTGQLVAHHLYVWNLRLVDGTIIGPAVTAEYRYFVAPALSAATT
jgi:hypothetical protein